MSTQIDCPVCLNAVTYLVNCSTTNCGHKFHTSCLLKCVSHIGFSCPYCRNNMANELREEQEVEPVPEPVRQQGRQPVRYPGRPARPARHQAIQQPDEPVVVKRMVFNGIRYLVATRTCEVYDYDAYICNQEQIEVGKWNATTKQVEFDLLGLNHV